MNPPCCFLEYNKATRSAPATTAPIRMRFLQTLDGGPLVRRPMGSVDESKSEMAQNGETRTHCMRAVDGTADIGAVFSAWDGT